MKIRSFGLLVSAALLLAAWAAVGASGAGDSTVPSIGATFDAARELASDGYGNHALWVHIGATVLRLIVAWGTAVVLGAAVGMVLGANPTVRRLFDPLITIGRFLAPAVFLAAFIAWSGTGNPSIVLITGFVPLFVTIDAVARSRERHTLAADLVPTLRITLVVAMIMLVRVEAIGSEAGLGSLISFANNFFRTDMVYAASFILAVVGLVFDYSIRIIGRTLIGPSAKLAMTAER